MSETKLKVILLQYTPCPEEIVAMAAKLCYSPSDIEILKEKIDAKKQKAFVEKLIKMGHMSPVEHISFTFAIEGISRACSHQLVRHRLASYSQQSQRYVSEHRTQNAEPRDQNAEHRPVLSEAEGTQIFDYIIPPSMAEDPEIKKAFESFMIQAQQTYDFLVKKLNKKGIKGEAANQDARFVLPNAAETKIMVTMNARELLHFFKMRCCNRAQWEIRQMSDEMLKLVKKVSPIIFSKAGPACLITSCQEGEYSCGKIEKVRKKYAAT